MHEAADYVMTVLADGRILADETAEQVAAKVAAGIVRLHKINPVLAEGIALFFHQPTNFGGMHVTMQHGKIVGVELSSTLR